MEEWKDIKGYEGLYMVSNLGNVKSLGNGNSRNKNNCKERIRKPTKNGSGYLQVQLYKDGIRKMHLVHRLVACAFIPNPQGLPEVNHLSEDKTDCRAENLEWCSHGYNQNYGTRNIRAGKSVSKANTNNPKRSKALIATNKVTRQTIEFPSAMEAERQLGINHSNIARCCNGNGYKSVGGYVWQYKD